jgi:gliding motility-associated lipoprotein GldH
MFKNRCSALLPVFSVLLLISCDNQALFDKVVSVPSDGWQAKKKFAFEFPVADTMQLYDILFHIRNQQNYAYSNLWLFVDVTAPNGYVKRDTLEIMLADKTGRWYGKGIGNVNSMLVPYKTETRFPFRGIYKITLQHAMYDDRLTNLLDIGIRVQPHQ